MVEPLSSVGVDAMRNSLTWLIGKVEGHAAWPEFSLTHPYGAHDVARAGAYTAGTLAMSDNTVDKLFDALVNTYNLMNRQAKTPGS